MCSNKLITYDLAILIMKAVILAGGRGSRMEEETYLKPKPMIEIGGKPILWHIMKIYSHYDINEFIVCCGYKGYLIKEYFANYSLHSSDVTIDIQKNNIDIHQNNSEPWRITLADTGLDTMSGGRVKRIEKYVNDDFCLTYGDGLCDVNISATIEFHKKNKFIGTVTAVQPPGRFGSLYIKQNEVLEFKEKVKGDLGWINGGFFVFNPNLFDYLKSDTTLLEGEPLETLAGQGKLGSYKHDGFWYAMDTLRDKEVLQELWSSNKAPWKLW